MSLEHTSRGPGTNRPAKTPDAAPALPSAVSGESPTEEAGLSPQGPPIGPAKGTAALEQLRSELLDLFDAQRESLAEARSLIESLLAAQNRADASEEHASTPPRIRRLG